MMGKTLQKFITNSHFVEKNIVSIALIISITFLYVGKKLENFSNVMRANPPFSPLSAVLPYSIHQEVYVHSNEFTETKHIPPILNCHHILKNDPNHKPQSMLER